MLKIRVVGFVLKKLLTYFEMMLVPHALHCVDICINFYILPQLTQSGILFWCPCPPTAPSPPSAKKKLDLDSLSNSLTRGFQIYIGFVLKKLLTYFKILIVPHALRCADSGIFVLFIFLD